MQYLLSLLILLVVGMTVCWDIYCHYKTIPQYTVSSTLSGWASQFPILPFTLGVFVGHVFWTR